MMVAAKALVILSGVSATVSLVGAWTTTTSYTTTRTAARIGWRSELHAKRNKKVQPKQDEDDPNRWYDSVDENASPDDVFWEEMERQRLLAKVGESPSSSSAPPDSPGGGSTSNVNLYASSTSSTTALSSQSLAKTNSLLQMSAMNSQTQRSADATLSEYEAFACADNWLDEDLAWMMNDDELYDYNTDEEHVKSLDEQLDDWEAMEDHDVNDDEEENTNVWMQSDEPWDNWGEAQQQKQTAMKDDDGGLRSKVEFSHSADAFLFDDDEVNEEDIAQMEQDTLARLSKISLQSPRLDRAQSSPNAKAYFQREPDAMEGYDRMWVSAIDNACFKNLVGLFSNYGVEFADNFGDWKDGSMEDSTTATIEDIASYKARLVYNITGLPCIAGRTSFEIEPVPDLNTEATQAATAAGRSAIPNSNPRVSSGYQFNDIGMHVDYICDALRPISEPERVTRFRTCLCFYDGEMELFDYGILDCDLIFANSMRTFIPMSQAINEMMQKLTLTFGLEYQQWLKTRVEEGMTGGIIGTASVKLRDRVLKEGKVLPNDIVDVSAFMDSKVDVNLMDDCAKELASRFMKEKPSKILTVATTGLVIALPMAKYLQVPVVYARKERSVVMADTFKAGYSSKTVGKNRELLVAKAHLEEDDRVLIVDDFLSSGASQEALLRMVAESGGTSVGVGVLLEKVYDSGRQFLSGFDVPIHSLCRIASVKDGVIQLLEEEGFDRMQKSKR
eukprot:CAMPEP_0198139252 /NCGR_PEP_ID=MMETSP1443-20131203/2596_1 /TAXON_ID=186043 /ORGANISM="Entomoneis sp., Strain CCMP2396" /LENGTH=729 /DNA_ID=CAMNT_0043801335 /DNA_START=252 /DNA_END=2441 /DNA_ORIENTATION=+